ncbi:hypothetical protein Q8A73_010546 [Channa argus]|nr:hypothetical protein Q8A73_010546 [Channa argus]
MIQRCCYSGTEPHQQQHHPSASSSSTAAKRSAPGSLSHSTAELARVQRLQGALSSPHKSFRRPLSAFQRRVSSASAPPPQNQTSRQRERCLIHILAGAPRLESHFYRGDCTVFSVCRVLIAWNRTKGMALRRKGKRHVQSWPVMDSLAGGVWGLGGFDRLRCCLAKRGLGAETT